MENEVKREELVAAYDATVAAFKPLYYAAQAHMKKVIEDFAMRNGFLEDVEIEATERHIRIAVKDEKERHWYKTEMFYEKQWGDKERRLNMSVGGYGNCGKDNATQRMMYAIVGKVATELDVLESAFGLFDWASYDAADHAMMDARYAVEKFDIDAKRAAREAAKADARARLVPGATIMTGEDKWSGTTYETIERVTAKTLFTKHFRVFRGERSVPYEERVKIEDAVERIADGNWKFAEAI